MAGRDHKLTRRAVLGATFAVPALAPAIAGAAPVHVWRRRIAALHRAEAELNLFCGRCRAGALVFADQAALDDAFGDRLGAFYTALRRLLRTPAPDFEALALKIALVADHEVGALTGGQRCLAALKADARRLSGRRKT
jgi:hypothetical protein